MNDVTLDEDEPGVLHVPWDSLLGKLIRKNSINFHVWKVPEDREIITDIASVKLLVLGIVSEKLNKKLTAQGILNRVLAADMGTLDFSGM